MLDCNVLVKSFCDLRAMEPELHHYVNLSLESYCLWYEKKPEPPYWWLSPLDGSLYLAYRSDDSGIMKTSRPPFSLSGTAGMMLNLTGSGIHPSGAADTTISPFTIKDTFLKRTYI